MGEEVLEVMGNIAAVVQEMLWAKRDERLSEQPQDPTEVFLGPQIQGNPGQGVQVPQG